MFVLVVSVLPRSVLFRSRREEQRGYSSTLRRTRSGSANNSEWLINSHSKRKNRPEARCLRTKKFFAPTFQLIQKAHVFQAAGSFFRSEAASGNSLSWMSTAYTAEAASQYSSKTSASYFVCAETRDQEFVSAGLLRHGFHGYHQWRYRPWAPPRLQCYLLSHFRGSCGDTAVYAIGAPAMILLSLFSFLRVHMRFKNYYGRTCDEIKR